MLEKELTNVEICAADFRFVAFLFDMLSQSVT